VVGGLAYCFDTGVIEIPSVRRKQRALPVELETSSHAGEQQFAPHPGHMESGSDVIHSNIVRVLAGAELDQRIHQNRLVGGNAGNRRVRVPVLSLTGELRYAVDAHVKTEDR